jgi:hypothetical protein
LIFGIAIPKDICRVVPARLHPSAIPSRLGNAAGDVCRASVIAESVTKPCRSAQLETSK